MSFATVYWITRYELQTRTSIGESVKIDLGKGVKTVDPAKVSAKTMRYAVNRFTGSAVSKGAKSAIKSVINKLK